MRRASRRFTSGAPAQLGWWAGEELRFAPSVVINLSRGGAALMVDEPTPRAREVYLQVAGREGPALAEAEVLLSRCVGGRAAVVHLRFRGRCPDDVLLAALEWDDAPRGAGLDQEDRPPG